MESFVPNLDKDIMHPFVSPPRTEYTRYWSVKDGCLTIWRVPIKLIEEFENDEHGLLHNAEWGGLESISKRTLTVEMLESGDIESD